MRIYIEPRDVWVGYYRGETHHYVCLLPCVVLRWGRRGRQRYIPNDNTLFTWVPNIADPTRPTKDELDKGTPL